MLVLGAFFVCITKSVFASAPQVHLCRDSAIGLLPIWIRFVPIIHSRQQQSVWQFLSSKCVWVIFGSRVYGLDILLLNTYIISIINTFGIVGLILYLHKCLSDRGCHGFHPTCRAHMCFFFHFINKDASYVKSWRHPSLLLIILPIIILLTPRYILLGEDLANSQPHIPFT